MDQNKLFDNRLLAAICTVTLIILCWGSFQRALSVDSFLMDESLQYYTAIGDHRFELGASTRAPLNKVIWHNFNDNLDPGGFTLLLNLWSLVSDHPQWLRALPFSLFVLALIGSFLCFWRKSLGRPWPALLLTALIASYGPILNWSFILRAYSFEICALAYLTYLFTNQGRRSSYLAYIPLLFFALSRYSFSIFLGIFFLFECQRLELLSRQKFKTLIILLMVSALCFGIFVGPVLATKLPLYIQQFTLLYRLNDFSQLSALLAKNLGSLTYGLLLLQIVFFWVLRSQLSVTTRRFFCFVICSHTSFIYLSAIGLYPWVMHERFGLSLSYLTFLAAGFMLIDIFLGSIELRKVLQAPLLFILIIVPALQIRAFHFDSYSAIAPVVDQLPLAQLKNKSVYLGHNAFFEAYFLFDKGRYKDQRDLFSRFHYDRPRGSLRPSRAYEYLVISQLDRTDRKIIEEELKLSPINSDSRTIVYKVEN